MIDDTPGFSLLFYGNSGISELILAVKQSESHKIKNFKVERHFHSIWSFPAFCCSSCAALLLLHFFSMPLLSCEQFWSEPRNELDKILTASCNSSALQRSSRGRRQPLGERNHHHLQGPSHQAEPSSKPSSNTHAVAREELPLVQPPQLCVPTADPAPLLARLAELGAQLHASQMQLNHLRATSRALYTHVSTLEEESAAALHRAHTAEERASLLAATAVAAAATTADGASTTLPVLRGKLLQAARQEAQAAAAQLRRATAHIRELESRHETKARAAACEAHALREQLRLACAQLAQRTVLYAAQSRAAREAGTMDSRTTAHLESQVAAARGREELLHEQIHRLESVLEAAA
eukprot:14835-Heterococcus_DN1.PRE.2